MLRRHLMGYLPSNLAPAFGAIAVVYIFTRLLTPGEYGLWALASNVNIMVQSCLFYWLQVSVVRFLPQSVQRDQDDGGDHRAQLEALIGVGNLGSVALSVVIYAAVLPFVQMEPDLRHVMWVALPMLLVRGVYSIALAEYRALTRIARYNIVECGQTALMLAIAMGLAWGLDLGAESLVYGTMMGSLVMIVPYLWENGQRCWGVLCRRRTLDPEMLKAFWRYGLPVTGVTALGYVISTFDRILIGYFLETADVGAYAVACGVVERCMNLIMISIVLAAFPLAVKAFDRGGAEAAQQQMRENGSTLVTLAVPVLVGMLVANRHIASVLIGAEFRDAAVQIMPWVGVTAFFSGLTLQYFNHAFLLTNNTGRLVWLQMPTAVLKVGANVLLLPRLGVMGAVWAALVTSIFGLVLSMVAGRRYLAVPVPWRDTLLSLLACLPVVALSQWSAVPVSGMGLTILMVAGVVTYFPLVLVLNIGGLRPVVMNKLRRKRQKETGNDRV